MTPLVANVQRRRDRRSADSGQRQSRTINTEKRGREKETGASEPVPREEFTFREIIRLVPTVQVPGNVRAGPSARGLGK